jgi:uncharacterized membrane protein
MSAMSNQNPSKGAKWAIWIFTALVIFAFVPSAIFKIIHAPMVVQTFIHIGIAEGAILPLGIIELTCLALYLISRTAVLGALLLTAYLGGAVLANIINHSDFIHAIVVGVFVWGGAWFRVPELQTLIPLRKTTDA